MIDVDERIKKYNETKKVAMSLRKEVEHLENLIEGLEDAIDNENKIAANLNNEVIASIKVGDLLDKVSSLLDVGRDELDVKITVLRGTYAKSLKELYGYNTENAQDLNSYLSIRLKDGTNICTRDLRLFNDLNEIQGDGYILLRHCTLESGSFQRSNLVVDKNMSDIICNFRIDALDMERYDGIESVLPLAIRQCIKEEENVYDRSYQKRFVRK